MTVSMMGISGGLPRFLGKSFSEQSIQDCKVWINASLFLTIVGFSVTTIFILLTQNWIVDTFRIEFNLLLTAILLIGCASIVSVLRSSVIASIKTKFLPVILSVSTIAKIGFAVFLITIGWEAFGLIIGYTIFDALSAILLALNLMFILKHAKNKSTIKFFQSVKDVFRASTVSWIPALITAFGTHLGIIFVFGTQGASQAGVYFIAFSIASAFALLMQALHGTAYPKLSGMSDRRKRFAWKTTKISLIVFIPFSSSTIFYSKEILQIFGESYTQGHLILEILMISMMPLVLANGIRILSYAYGNYRQVLAIGMATSFPRIALYLMLVPIYGSLGAGISFTTGALAGLVVSAIIARKIQMKIFWKDIGLIISIPMALSFVLSYFEINVIIGIVTTSLISYLIYAKFHILERSELEDLIRTFPDRVSPRLLRVVDVLAKRLNLFP